MRCKLAYHPIRGRRLGEQLVKPLIVTVKVHLGKPLRPSATTSDMQTDPLHEGKETRLTLTCVGGA